jgi:small subunit ribosomal protein S21
MIPAFETREFIGRGSVSTRVNVTVTVQRDEPIEKALRRFKRMCDSYGISRIVRQKERYEKPSDLRRRELRKRERNALRAQRKSRERLERRMSRARSRQRARELGVGPTEGGSDRDQG